MIGIRTLPIAKTVADINLKQVGRTDSSEALNRFQILWPERMPVLERK